MKVLSWLRVRMSNLSLVLVLGMGMILGMSVWSGYNKNAFSTLCAVLKSTERLLNTNTISEPLKSEMEYALYGRPGGVLTVENGKVSVKANRDSPINRSELCTYYNGGYGCFAESLAGTLLCTCTPGEGGKDFCGLGTLQNADPWSGGSTPLERKQDLFQSLWDQVRNKCPYGKGTKQGTHGDDVGHLEKAVQRVRDTLKQALPFFYLGGRPGRKVPCSGSDPRNVCAAYYTCGWSRQHVHIPWLDTIQQALEDLKAVSQTVSVPSTPTHGRDPSRI
ncbi:Variant surface glycoprotein [Trypanosoma congolense IL3000]|uniref:Variant surface glycoprotein n=1 Tax=Trypanosoma congolense (strain IL3000) TaxID=1068625 RepID=F9WJE9_TRYCI|nr:Variant surface glycoprotein [Trypanosoma congolense IL3000]